ncbi:serine hydrolase domain-containing protein [soil metagenome]
MLVRGSTQLTARLSDLAGAPSASILICYRGEAVFNQACGLATLEPRTPASVRTSYRLASLTKQFTATAILQLVDKGEIRLETGVADVLPELSRCAEGVCVRHLLTHTSGIWDYEELLPASQTDQVADGEVLTLLSQVNQGYFPRGAAFRYSNSGYVLLGLIVERISGCSFADFLRTQIFRPLGMDSTLAYEPGISSIPERAYGYSGIPGGFSLNDQSTTSATLADGGVYSSTADLARWEHALTHAHLLPASTLEQTWGPARLNDGTPVPYGFGWYVDTDRGRLRLTHHGETAGFTNAAVRYPNEQLGVWVLTNRTGGAPWNLAQNVADGALALLEKAPAAPSTAPWPFQRFVHR